jgi:hypothetical protein
MSYDHLLAKNSGIDTGKFPTSVAAPAKGTHASFWETQSLCC